MTNAIYLVYISCFNVTCAIFIATRLKLQCTMGMFDRVERSSKNGQSLIRNNPSEIYCLEACKVFYL